MQRVWHLSAFELLLLLGCLEDASPFETAFTIVNKANGRRVFSSDRSGLFTIDDFEPVYFDQLWSLVPFENSSFVIKNVAHGMRIAAQSGLNDQDGFFAINHGPKYQDQRWRFIEQVDGSYVIANLKSGRRLATSIAASGQVTFAAVRGHGLVKPDQTWWLVNGGKDATVKLFFELTSMKQVHAILISETRTLGNLSDSLRTQLDENQFVLDQQAKDFNHLTLKLHAEQASRNILLEEIKLCTWDLKSEKDTKTLLENRANTLQLELSANKLLGHEVDMLNKKLNACASDLSTQENSEAALQKQLEALLMQQKGDQASKKDLLERLELLNNISAHRVEELQARIGHLTNTLQQEEAAKLALHQKLESFHALPGVVLCWLQFEARSKFAAAVAMLICVAAAVAMCRRHFNRISQMECELRENFGGLVKVGDSVGQLGIGDFGFQVFNEEVAGETVRVIKVQCPGVKHSDIEVELIFNGCILTIRRRASRGVVSTTWRKRFQFRPSDGLFEFKEDQMQLEQGFLQLVFRAYSFQTRVILFPQHFDLAASDSDRCWEYSAEGAVEVSDEVEAWWHGAVEPLPVNLQDASQERPLMHKVESQVEDTVSTASTSGISK